MERIWRLLCRYIRFDVGRRWDYFFYYRGRPTKRNRTHDLHCRPHRIDTLLNQGPF